MYWGFERVAPFTYTAIDDKNATRTGKTPPKLVKISADMLSQPLVDVINNSISKEVFPDNAKSASVSPIDN